MRIQRVIVAYGQARFDLSDTCCFCLGFINENDYYVKSQSGKTAHYPCGKENGWRKKSTVKKKFTQPVKKTVENPRTIKVIRDGRVIK